MTLYLGFVRRRVKKRFLVSNISAGNTTLCREHHVTRQLRLGRACYKPFFHSSLTKLLLELCRLSAQFVASDHVYTMHLISNLTLLVCTRLLCAAVPEPVHRVRDIHICYALVTLSKCGYSASIIFYFIFCL